MKIVTMQLKDLKPSPYNPRKKLKAGDPRYETISRSISEFGYVDPIIYNERTGHVVGGNQRLQVLFDKGVTEVDVSVVDLDEAEEKALNLVLNKSAQGEWDIPSLKDVLLELDTGAFDIEITGFSIGEIENLMTLESTGKLSQYATEGQIQALEAKMASAEKYKSDKAQENYVDMTCPGCGESFTLSTDEILKGKRYEQKPE